VVRHADQFAFATVCNFAKALPVAVPDVSRPFRIPPHVTVREIWGDRFFKP
jgi:hypothetical protein